MSAIQKIFIAFFILMTIISISSVSYSMHIYFKALDTTNDIKVSVTDIKIVYPYPGSPYVSINTTIYIENPTDLSLKYNSVGTKLYLNSPNNYLGESYFYVPYHRMPRLDPFSNVTVTISIANVPSNQVTVDHKTWIAKITVWLYGIPMFEGGALFRRDVPYSG